MAVKKKGLSLRKEPNQERAISTMEDIYRATAHILEKEGFEKASTNKTAAKAGISIGSLYQYFPTKESIIALMMERFIKAEMDRMDAILKEKKTDNLKETLRMIIAAMLDTKIKNKRFTKIFAQKIFGFNKFDMMKRSDEYMLALFKSHIGPFESQIRTENLDMSMYLILQAMKLVPVNIIFDERYELSDPKLLDELVHMTYQYLRKD